MSHLNSQLRASLLDRARGFEKAIDAELGALGSGVPGLAHALGLMRHYADRFQFQVDHAWHAAPSDDIRLSSLQQWNDHLRSQIVLFDSYFRRGHAGVPHSLLAEIERECDRVGLGPHEAVVSFGSPINFESFVADLAKYLFSEFDIDPEIPAHLTSRPILLIVVPEAEGARAAWQPIIAGHELGHFLELSRPLGLTVLLDKARLSATQDAVPRKPGSPAYSRSRSLQIIASNWLREIVCDAYAVHRYGAGAVAAMSDYFSFVSPQSIPGRTHPPRSFRTKLMMNWVKGASAVQDEIFESFAELSKDGIALDWATYICGEIEKVADSIYQKVEDIWKLGRPYADRQRDQIVDKVAGLLLAGIPGTETVTVGGSEVDVEPADVVNAVWLASKTPSTKPINRLALKSLDTLDFMTRWKMSSGPAGRFPDPQLSPSFGALTGPEISRRLRSTNKDALVITPLIPGAVGGASIDLRLGNRFIVFQRSNSPAFDALDDRLDPRGFQTMVEKSWGDVFYLHPGQLVLAATLEYMVLPGDLTAQVITRSSYGRLGLLSATAVQVHPHFAGCLTLELVNLGEMPMAITPGERVAQLVMWTTSSALAPPSDEDDKYRFPTGPEFSKIKQDEEGAALANLRKSYRNGR